MDELEIELKELIVDVLRLEDVTSSEIDSSAPLFGPGLGLTSIDALELAMALNKKYGVVLDPDNELNKAAFENVRALATFIASQPRKASP
jgi:acyl carrier protein